MSLHLAPPITGAAAFERVMARRSVEAGHVDAMVSRVRHGDATRCAHSPRVTDLLAACALVLAVTGIVIMLALARPPRCQVCGVRAVSAEEYEV